CHDETKNYSLARNSEFRGHHQPQPAGGAKIGPPADGAALHRRSTESPSTKTKTMKIKLLTAVALATLAVHDPIHAGQHIWSGTQDGNWGNPANWSSGGPPSAFEAPPVIVQFPSALSARRQTTNNIYNLQLDVLQFFGADYTLR